jgi:diphthamide biosynthesis protein 2
MAAPATAPVLSTPDTHILEEATNQTVHTSETVLSEEQLYIQYEIQRTVREIRRHGWKRVGLQFPDDMLRDAPRVSDRLLRELRKTRGKQNSNHINDSEAPSAGLDEVSLEQDGLRIENESGENGTNEAEEKLTILADTSYGACCVDEIAAEHVDAEAVVHYGRACLSPTARLPVVYVFTSKPLHLDCTVKVFKATYPDRDEKICLLADVPYAAHVHPLAARLRLENYTNLFATDIVHEPSYLLPNRTLPAEVRELGPEKLKDFSVFHISDPPTALQLILTSRVKSIFIYATDTVPTAGSALQPAQTTPLLRRRYAHLTLVPTTPIIGILINTLSVANYMTALAHVQDTITAAGKKYYTFVVGKLNPAKLANFAEVGVWVVIGCWESSLVDATEFYKPVVTPFELEVGLGLRDKGWAGEWIADFGEVIARARTEQDTEKTVEADATTYSAQEEDSAREVGDWDDTPSDDDPPEFDLRTGRYVSNARPVRRAHPSASLSTEASEAPPSSALVQRPKADVATVNGTVSPAAEFLHSKRTWQGLGSDYEVAYERDEDGKIRGAAMEEGRSGLAQGYGVGENHTRS